MADPGIPLIHFAYCAHCPGPANSLTRLGAAIVQCVSCGAVEREFDSQEWDERERRFHLWKSRCTRFLAESPECRAHPSQCSGCEHRSLVHFPEAHHVLHV